MDKYIHVKNLEKYHPSYQDRKLIWCKAYFSMINADPDFEMLCEIDKWRFIAFVMLELQTQKPILINNEYLTRKGFDLKKRSIELTLQMLHTFIETVTKPLQNRDVEEDKGEYKREYKEDIDTRNETVPPLRADVINYIKEKRLPVDAEHFFSYYESNGWRVGRNPMKSWKGALTTWVKNNKQSKNYIKEQPTRTTQNWTPPKDPPPFEMPEEIKKELEKLKNMK